MLVRPHGTVRQRNGRWQAAYQSKANGGRQIARTFDSEKAAREWLVMEFHGTPGHSAGIHGTPGQSIRVGDFWASWLASRKLAPRTRDSYESTWRLHLAPTFSRLRMIDVTPLTVRSWFAAMPESAHRAKSYRVLAAMFRDALRDNVIDRCPCTLRGAGREHVPPVCVVAPGDLERIAEAVPGHLRVMVLVAAYGGLRYGELAGLDVSCVDTAAGTVRVEGTLQELHGALSFGPPKSAAGRRTVVLPASVMAELSAHIDGRSGLVFTNGDGSPLRRSSFGAVWRRAVRNAGLQPLRFHSLRHTAATMATTNGATLAEVMSRIGHSSVAAAVRYQHLVSGRDDVLASRLDALRLSAS
jgi:integrase